MLIDRLEEKKNFTHAESNLADFILENLVESTEIPIAEFSKKSFTSKATITRFCKKVGLSGYIEFQKTLLQEITENKRISAMMNEEPINSETSYKEVLTIIPSIYEKAISQTKMSLDKNQLSRILNRLKHVSKLDIYGLGVTNAVAEISSFKFSTIGIESESHAGLNEHYVMATKDKKNRIAILLSFSGSNNKIISIAKYLKRFGTYVSFLFLNGKNFNRYMADTLHIRRVFLYSDY